MKTRRDAASVIWRTVVVAGAMLGAPACKKDAPAPTVPTNNGGQVDPNSMDVHEHDGGDMYGGDMYGGGMDDGWDNPCAMRDDDGSGVTGRGFILS
ncbi:MAG: hypothetical protein R2939_11555 [Kofleriaceae bacterium]